MTRRDRNAAAKHYGRIQRELARQNLSEIFAFIGDGVPVDWNPKPKGPRLNQKQIRDTQAAFATILDAAITQSPPPAGSIEILNECLALPGKVCPYVHGKLIQFKIDPATGTVVDANVPAWRYASATSDYRKRAAEILRLILLDYFGEAFTLRNCLVAKCVVCGTAYLRSRSDQQCCSRQCTQKHDYETKRKGESNRAKSRRSYASYGAQKKRIRAKKGKG